MSKKYDKFLIEHRAAVFDCWQRIKKHLPNVAKQAKLDGFKHDESKEDSDRADPQYPAASITLEREQVVDLIVWLAQTLDDRCPGLPFCDI